MIRRLLVLVSVTALVASLMAGGVAQAQTGEDPATTDTTAVDGTTTSEAPAPEATTDDTVPAAPAESDASAAPEGSFSVINGNDSGTGSYRQAISDAEADGSADVITFNAGLTVTLASDVQYLSTTTLTINGNGSTIDGNGNRILAANASLLTINDLTLTGGQAADQGGAVNAANDLVINRSTLTDNAVVAADGASGGAVVAQGGLTISDSTLSDNTATANGTGGSAAGGAAAGNGDFTITDSTFSGNTVTATAIAQGGALATDGAATVANSTLTGNTVTGGTESTGSAILVGGAGGTDLTHVTVASNSGDSQLFLFAPLETFGTVFADPQGGVNCGLTGATTANGYNWSDDTSCGLTGTGDTQNGADPLLGQARDNGSPPTMFPLLGSPLVDAIPNAACDPTLTADQRGVPRPFPTGGACDIGAIEAVFPAHSLTGVTPFYEATVRWVTSTVNTPQILQGYNDGTFGQSLPINRGQTARLYYRAAGAPDVSSLPAHGFTDVSPFFEDAVTWAKANGLFDGYTDNTFREKNPINRGNYTRSLYNFAGSPDVSGLPDHGFSDVTLFYDDAVTWAKANGLADGFPNNTFRQNNPITRGNASRIFYNTAQTKPAWADTMTAPPNMLFKSNLTT